MTWSTTCGALMMAMALQNVIGAVEHRAPEGYRGELGDDPVKRPLPIGIETTLEVPPGPLLLGAGWVVHYVVTNRGEQTFRIELGGDYRGLRPVRTWLEALDPDGAFAADPLRGSRFGSAGGLMSVPELRSGQEEVITINPRLYVRIDRPGRWTLRVFQDLGLGPAHTDRDPRWAEAVVDVVMPDAAQAAAVLAEHESRFDFDGGVIGERSGIGPDFAAMAIPIYLPLLDARARQGSRLAIEGLAAIPTAAAVEALLGVLERPVSPPPAREAAYLEHGRSFAGEHLHAAAFEALCARLRPTMEQRDHQGEGDPALLATMDVASTARLRRLAGAALLAPESEVREAAASVLERSPGPESAELLLDALDRMVEGDDANTLNRLIGAWRGLGQQAPPPTARPAGALIWIDHLQQDPAWRPEGWRDTLILLLQHSAPRVREHALRLVPDDQPERWAPLLIVLLGDPDAQVRWSAVANGGRCRHPSLLPGLRAAMSDERTYRFAPGAIGAIAGRDAEVLAWFDLIADGTIKHAASYGLHSGWFAMTGANLSGGWADGEPSVEQRRTIAARLRAFVAEHRQALTAGRLTAPDATWPADLLPGNWYMTLPGDGRWPTGR